MSISHKFLPSEAIIKGKYFYNHAGIELNATETKLYEYVQGFQAMLTEQGVVFSPDEFRSIQTATALIDALAKTRFSLSESNSFTLETGHHVFNVFYKASDSDTWKLQFANSSYLEKVGANLSDMVQTSESDLMQTLYTKETIEKFSAAKNPQGGYRAQYVEMDKITVNENENKPAFFWYRKEFDHPDGGKLQVRIGMNGTELLPEHRLDLTDAYTLADILRTEDMNLVHYSSPSYQLLIIRIKNQLSSILEHDAEQNSLVLPLGWIKMILEIADDIVKNGPFPLTIINEKGVIEHISPAYAAMIGYTVSDILDSGFFDRIYPGVEGAIVKQSIAFYQKNGHYPEDISFLVSRGKKFRELEGQNNLRPLKGLELVPFPYAFKNGTIRLNSAQLLGSIEGIDYATDTTARFELMDANTSSEPEQAEANLKNWLRDNS